MLLWCETILSSQRTCIYSWPAREVEDYVNPVKAKQFLQRWRDEDRAAFYGGSLPGVQVRNKALTVSELITAYQEAGHPNPKMKPKPAKSVRREKSLLKPIAIYFGGKSPDNLTLAD